jgi:hypothetical protein
MISFAVLCLILIHLLAREVLDSLSMGAYI